VHQSAVLEGTRPRSGTNDYPFSPDEVDFTAVLLDARAQQLSRLEILRVDIEALGLDWILPPPAG
jgi:hypothetical protein